MSLSRCLLRHSASNNGMTLKSGGRGRSRSLKITPFDRSYYTTYYWPAIVSVALSCTTFELFDVK